MASYQSTSALSGSKITKSRSKMAVKPILKKLSHSEKNSLDIDRGWEDQIHYSSHGWGAGSGSGSGSAAKGGSGAHPYDGSTIAISNNNGRLARDVSFSLSASDLHSGLSGGAGRTKFTHV